LPHLLKAIDERHLKILDRARALDHCSLQGDYSHAGQNAAHSVVAYANKKIYITKKGIWKQK
jgi:hypothetical protein